MRSWEVLVVLGVTTVLTRVQAEISEQDCQAPANEIIRENCKAGNDSRYWDVNADGDPTIQGFSDPFSVGQGERIVFKIKTDSEDYYVDIFRVGWYWGAGARHVTTLTPSPDLQLPQVQPDCERDGETLMYDCGAWEESVAWEVPEDQSSGVYLARLTRRDGETTWRTDNSHYPADSRFSYPDDKPGQLPAPPQPWPHAYGAQGHGQLSNSLHQPKASLVYFVVRKDDSQSEVLFQTSDTTWQAYNLYGGANTYYGLSPPFRRAYKVSYNRPWQTRATRAINILFGAEYPLIRWLESHGYDVTYQSGIDTHRNSVQSLNKHKLFLSVGHDEYWSGQQRSNVELARDSGLNLAFFSGNEVFWRVRWENDYRHLVVYKESQEKVKIDPELDEWTGTWRDGRPINPLGPQPENSLTGTIFTVNAWRHDALEVPARFSRLRFWRNTSVAELQPGEKRTIKPGLLGHEWDEDLDNGFRPPGLVRLSETTVNNLWMIQDYGANYDSGTATHSLVIYRSSSGSLVFGAGTVQWSWGLDPHHDTVTGIPPEKSSPTNIRVGQDQMGAERDIIQATLNLFADMGVHPAAVALSPGLVAPEMSEDVTAPTITSLTEAEGLIICKAEDVGGLVAAVEFSLDGETWHPAEYRDQATWVIRLVLSRTAESLGYNLKRGDNLVRARGVDDSYNVGQISTLAVTL